MVEINEFAIKQTKDRIIDALPGLLKCADYIKRVKHTTPLGSNEQVAKDQLVLPVLSLLGYSTEFDAEHDHLELVAEAATSTANKGPRVDYAIFIMNDTQTGDDKCPVPRVLIEAKAFDKFDQHRADYGDLQSQVGHYYSNYSKVVYLPIASSGNEWVFYGRSQSEIADAGLEPKEYFKLSDLNNPEKLDCFVRLASKTVIEAHTLENCTIDDYENYRKAVNDDLKLRQKISEAFLKYDIATYDDLINNVSTIRSKILDPLEIEPPKRNKDEWYKKKVEEVRDIFIQLKKATEVPEAHKAPEAHIIQEPNEDSEQSKDPVPPKTLEYVSIPEGENNEFLYSNVEQQIAHKIWSILNDSDIGHKDFWNDDTRQDDCLVKHLNSFVFISYLVANPNIECSELMPVSGKWHDKKAQYHWVIRLGNRIDTITEKEHYAEIELCGNAAIGFRIDTEDEFKIIESLIKDGLQYKLCSTNLKGVGTKQSAKDEDNLRCWIAIDSVGDLDYLKDAIIYCYRKQIEKLLGEIG